MRIGWLILWLVGLGLPSLIAAILWRRLLFLRAEVRHLLADRTLSREVPGPRLVREIHNDLRKVALR